MHRRGGDLLRGFLGAAVARIHAAFFADILRHVLLRLLGAAVARVPAAFFSLT